MGTPAFPDLGKHCAVRECSLVDFLPFTCDACKQVFCLEHRTYGNHSCPKANAQDVTVLVCPMCAKGVRLVAQEDPNVTWERHVQTNCDPSNYTKVTKKPRCIVPGCKEILTFSNKVRCKDCGREVCLKHRFGADHNCQELRKADAAKNSSFFGNKFLQSFSKRASLAPTGVTVTGPTVSSTSQSQSEALRAGFQTAASTVEKSIGRLGATTSDWFNSMTGSVNRVQSPVSLAPSRLPTRTNNSSARELCPQCGATFNTVSELIQHAERIHTTGQWRVASSQEQLDICPKCGRGFDDAISLVNHVERDHGGTSSSNPENCSIS
ncbi:unnamed protein product [Calypogeia fissa]